VSWQPFEEIAVEEILEFNPFLVACLPVTHALLKAAHLTVHSCVDRVVLHGSRGLAGGYRPDSDLDLSLIVEPPASLPPAAMDALLQEVLETTLHHWQGAVEADLAAVFEVRDCGLKCFDLTAWEDSSCLLGGEDCFGLYKIQKGFRGRVEHAGVQVKRMIPCLTIWQRPHGRLEKGTL